MHVMAINRATWQSRGTGSLDFWPAIWNSAVILFQEDNHFARPVQRLYYFERLGWAVLHALMSSSLDLTWSEGAHGRPSAEGALMTLTITTSIPGAGKRWLAVIPFCSV